MQSFNVLFSLNEEYFISFFSLVMPIFIREQPMVR